MGLLGRQTVIAKCPACQATTKVSAHPDKPSIRCPRCKSSVPLAFARKMEDKAPAEPERRPLKQESTSLDYGSEIPGSSNGHTSSSNSKRRVKRYASNASSDFNYPDHSVNFVRYSIIAVVAISLLAVLGIGFLFWRESINARNQEYISNIKDSIEYHQRALASIKKVLDPLEATESQKSFREAKAKIEFLAARRRHLTVPTDDSVEGLVELVAELNKAEKELSKSEEEIKKLTTQQVSSKQESDESVASRLGSSTMNGPPKSPTQVNSSRKTADATSVIINIPGLSKTEWSEEFARNFSLIADNGDGKVSVAWLGDLLQIEVRPVVDPARYATKISFARLIYYSRNDRTLTIEFKPDRVNNYTAQGDRITPLLIDLKQREKLPKVLSALSQLGNLKVDPARQAEVSAILETIASDGKLDSAIRDMGIKLLPQWSGKESAELLIRLLEDKSALIRLSAIDALVETHSPLAAQALVKKWDKAEPERISRALIALGSDVEPMVLPFLNNNSSDVLRIEACRVLQEIGTGESLKPLLDLMNAKNQSPQLIEAAKNAMKQILDRKTK